MNGYLYLGIAAMAGGLYYWRSMTPPLVPGQKSLTLYYASWCGHCKRFMPEWNKLGCYYKDIVIRKVESKENNEIEVQGFPTVIYRDEAGQTIAYDGPRNSKDIKDWLDSE